MHWGKVGRGVTCTSCFRYEKMFSKWRYLGSWESVPAERAAAVVLAAPSALPPAAEVGTRHHLLRTVPHPLRRSRRSNANPSWPVSLTQTCLNAVLVLADKKCGLHRISVREGPFEGQGMDHCRYLQWSMVKALAGISRLLFAPFTFNFFLRLSLLQMRID